MTAFDNLITDSMTEAFTADPELNNYPRQVEQLYSHVLPEPAAKPEFIVLTEGLIESLGLSHMPEDELLDLFSGHAQYPIKPYAMNYGGHQFGHWAGQLGDGRAINLGQVSTADGPQHLQLKGAGPTPYSRHADGYAVLRSSIREYLCSEAMYHLGIPTTRAACLLTTGRQVARDVFYDGHVEHEPGAIVCRVAPSFLRFGHFELLARRQQTKDLKQLLHYTIKMFYPELNQEVPKKQPVLWFKQVCQDTATMVAHWMRVGFVHGVMNTDNLSIHGITIDYGPYGWLDHYDPEWTPNTTDREHRRYRYEHQPYIAQWNLYQLANALAVIVDDSESLQICLNDFVQDYEKSHYTMQLGKIGLSSLTTTSKALINDLHQRLRDVETDWTLFYWQLRQVVDFIYHHKTFSWDDIEPMLADCYYEKPNKAYQQAILTWFKQYQSLLSTQSLDDALNRMQKNNPCFILRNYLSQQAIERAYKQDYSMIHELMQALKKPNEKLGSSESFYNKRPEWARNKPGSAMLSCSS